MMIKIDTHLTRRQLDILSAIMKEPKNSDKSRAFFIREAIDMYIDAYLKEKARELASTR